MQPRQKLETIRQKDQESRSKEELKPHYDKVSEVNQDIDLLPISFLVLDAFESMEHRENSQLAEPLLTLLRQKVSTKDQLRRELEYLLQGEERIKDERCLEGECEQVGFCLPAISENQIQLANLINYFGQSSQQLAKLFLDEHILEYLS